MTKKEQGIDSNQNDSTAAQEIRAIDKKIIRYIIRILLLVILFIWALMNLDAVIKSFGKVPSLCSRPLVRAPTGTRSILFLIHLNAAGRKCSKRLLQS